MNGTGDRRNFLVRTIYALGALISGGLGLPAAGYLLVPGRSRGGSEWIEVGPAVQFQPRAPEEIVFRRNRVDGWKVTSEKSTAWVVKLSDTEVIALAPQCTHLGCAYSFDEKKGEFLCPCHTSNFSLEGKVLHGPAPRPLDRYSVKVDGGRVFIGNLDQPIKSA
jgi:menaquinol-cytochrome c reductase iron-sulfur subunit